MAQSVTPRLRTVAAGLALIGTLGLAACDSPEDRLARHYERGVELAEKGDDELAVLEFRNALRLERDHAPSRLALAMAQERLGNLRPAIAQYRAVIELDATNVEARVRLGRILLAGGAIDEAMTLAGEAVGLAPADPGALVVRAAAALRVGNAADAVRDAQAALAAAPGDPAAEAVLAAERLAAGDPAAAVARLDAALATTPTDVGLNLLKLQALAQEGAPEPIGAHLAAMVERFPAERQFRRALAQWRMQQGDTAGAEAELRAVADAAPDELEPSLDVVRFLRETQGNDVARAELERRIAAAGPTLAVELMYALAALDNENGRPDAARATLQSAIERAPDEAEADRARVRLASLLIETDAAAAATLVDAVLERDDKNAEALALRASLAIDDYRADDAIADLRRALDVDPQNPRLLLLEARAHERAGNLDLAGERLAAAARAAGFAPDVAMRYVEFLRLRNDLRGGETVLTEVARRHPQDRGALTALAEIRLRLGDWVGAEQAAQSLRALDGGAGLADQITAVALGGQGRTEESIARFEDAFRQPGGDQRAMAGLVSAYVRAGEVAKARAFLEEVLAANPQNARALLLSAELELLEGDEAAALRLLEAVIAAAPTEPVGHIALVRFHLRAGRLAEAETAARDGLARSDRPAPLRLMLAQILERRAGFDDAIAEYEQLYRADPDSVVYANNLASLLAEHRADDPEAMALAARLAQRLRGYDVPQLQDTYGWIMFLTGDIEAALRSLTPAAEALPDNALVRYHAGRAYAAAGQTAEARGHLEAALAVDPGFPKADSARTALAALPSPGQ